MMVVSNEKCRKDDSSSGVSYMAPKIRTKMEKWREWADISTEEKEPETLRVDLSGLRQQTRSPCR